MVGRRLLVTWLFVLVAFAGGGRTAAAAGDLQTPIRLGPGPHLFIDEHLIADSSFLSRVVNNPVKLAQPVITGGKTGDDNFQPYLSVLRDPKSGRFRMWYNTSEGQETSVSHVSYIESEDGINWIRPHKVLKDPGPIKFGVTVLDRGETFPEPQHRYVHAYYYKDGLMIATSPDGFEFKLLSPTSVLQHNHDINSLEWDPIRRRYMLLFSVWFEKPEWGDRCRIPHQSVSDDLLNWREPWPIITPKVGAPIERGETQFYSMSGVLARGNLLIGLVKVLRDDLNATPGKSGKEMGDMDRKAAGVGYTVLAWTRDGEHWRRDHEPFIPRNPLPGSWDHAMAWGDEQIAVGDETFLYYGGYARGHKVARFDERQIGLARMPRDRYVSRDADRHPGRLVTKPLVLDARAMTVNANVVGAARVRILDVDGRIQKEFDWVKLAGDSIAHALPWKLESLQGPVRLEFELQDAQLYGFDLTK